MRWRWQIVAASVAAVVWVGSADPVFSQYERWQLRGSALGAQPTSGIGSDPSLGFGLGLEYRLSPRFGVELGGLTAEAVQEEELGIIFISFNVQSTVRYTPILGRLNFHFTPGRAVDFYGGPVVGYAGMSDMTQRIEIDGFFGSESFEQRFEADDQFVWGAALGFDVALGGSGSFLTFGVTYLDLPLEVELPLPIDDPDFPDGPDDGAEEQQFFGDVDPVLVSFGYGVRF